MPSSRSHHTSAIVVLLSYLLIVSPFIPSAITANSASAGKLPHGTERELAPHREGELLMRFRAGVSQREKDMIIAAQGARRKKQLEGESGVERLELQVGHEASTVALQMISNPQVEFASRTS